MDPLKKIQQARVRMMIKHPFFGYLAISLEPVETSNLPFKTMGTDGRYLFYDPEYAVNTPLDELTAGIAHEIGHIILHHISRRQGRHAMRWNYAADYADNLLLVADGFYIDAKKYLLDYKYQDMSTEAIYSKLPEPQENTITICIDGCSGQMMDDHDPWKNWGKGNGNDEKDDKDQDGQPADGSGDGDKPNGQAPKPLDEGIVDNLEAEWRERVASAAQQARMKGDLPGHIKTLVDNILQPKLDWKSLLRDRITSAAKNNYTFSPFSKKQLYRGFYMPGVTGEEICIAVALDTSGSVSDPELAEFVAEVKGICDSYDQFTIYLCACDTHIHEKWVIEGMDPLPTVFSGRGGTDFREPFKWVEDELLDKGITTFVYLTDSCGTFPEKEPGYPVIWVINTPDGKVPWGQAIYLPRKEN